MRFLTTIITLLACTQLWAQKLTTPTPVYDCGQILFRTPITTKFVIRNKGMRTATISNVLTSCGCTTATAKQTKVGGGKEITVDATYDAKQLGHFQKEIWIYEEGQEKPLELILKGVVVTEIKDYSGTYPCALGQIRSDIDEIEFDDVNCGNIPSKTFHIFNTSSEVIEPVIMHLPEYLKASISPTRIAPEQGGEVTFHLMSDKLRNMGLTQTSVYLGKFPGDKVSAEKEIPVSVVLLPSLQDINFTDRNTAPLLQLSATVLKKSEMTGKPNKLKGEIILQNVGKSELEIQSLQMFTAGMKVALPKSRLQPSEMTKLKVEANDLELQQIKQKPRILMITNDPTHPKVIIEIQ